MIHVDISLGLVIVTLLQLFGASLMSLIIVVAALRFRRAAHVKCQHIVASGKGVTARCWRPEGHTGEHAARLSSLQAAGWAQIPF